MKRSTAEKLKLPILGIFRSFAAVGVEPSIMGVGPAYLPFPFLLFLSFLILAARSRYVAISFQPKLTEKLDPYYSGFPNLFAYKLGNILCVGHYLLLKPQQGNILEFNLSKTRIFLTCNELQQSKFWDLHCEYFTN
jgi:hypothetical protein